MPSDALLNQQLLDQMFARSVAPLSTGLEQARQRADRERELRTEMNFRREMADKQTAAQTALAREQMQAQAGLAREQQAAILKREEAVRELERKDRELGILRAKNLYSPEELAKAEADPAYRNQLLNTLAGKESTQAEAGFGVLSEEKDRLTRELAYELENGSRSLGREAKSLAVTEFLQGLDEDSRTRVSRALGRAGKGLEDLTPEMLDQIMQSDPGLLGTKRFGFSDEERIDAMLAFKSALDRAAIANKQPPLGAMQTMAKIQSIDSALADRAKLFPEAYTKFVGTRLGETKKRISEAKTGMEREGFGLTPAAPDAAAQAQAGLANLFGTPAVTPSPAVPPENYGGALGLIGKIPSAVSGIPGYIDEKQRAAAFGLAGMVGGQKLQGQLQGAYDWRTAQEQAILGRLRAAQAAQENVNPDLLNFAPF